MLHFLPCGSLLTPPPPAPAAQMQLLRDSLASLRRPHGPNWSLQASQLPVWAGTDVGDWPTEGGRGHNAVQHNMCLMHEPNVHDVIEYGDGECGERVWRQGPAAGWDEIDAWTSVGRVLLSGHASNHHSQLLQRLLPNPAISPACSPVCGEDSPVCRGGGHML